jgi:hypothetical protein
MRERYETLGIELRIRESVLFPAWLESRRASGSNQTVVMTWDVTKTTPRHDAAVVGPGHGWIGGTVSRTLAATSQGCLLELDGGGVVRMRSLTDVHALVRHSHSGSNCYPSIVEGLQECMAPLVEMLCWSRYWMLLPTLLTIEHFTSRM